MAQPAVRIPASSDNVRRARARYRSRPYDTHNLYVSLKQWRILHAVVDCGGFAEAAEHLHLSQSAISYTLAKMQAQLGVQLLKLEGRKAILTSEGRALLERSRQVLKEAVELEKCAKNMQQGWGEEVLLVVDHNFPTSLLMKALHKATRLGDGGPRVRLSELSSLIPEETLRNSTTDLAICERVPLGFIGERLMEIEYIPVAHPAHPLLALGREVTAADLAQQLQIGVGPLNVAGKSGWGDTSDMRRWSMSSFDSVVEAVSECHGYAWVPEHRIRHWLERGTLMRLPVGDRRALKVVLYLVHARPWASNSAARRFAEILHGVANGTTAQAGSRNG